VLPVAYPLQLLYNDTTLSLNLGTSVQAVNLKTSGKAALRNERNDNDDDNNNNKSLIFKIILIFILKSCTD
jgi:hypothetical protein